MRNSGDRICVVGASGFIGAHIAESVERFHEVSTTAAPRLRLSAGSLDQMRRQLDLDLIVQFADDHLRGVDVVVNAAGIAEATSSDLSGLLGANAALPLFLASACDRAGVRRLVHVSSGAVRGTYPLDDSETMHPNTRYGLSKAVGEALLRSANVQTEVIRYRPPSVQGSERALTQKLARFARSPLASVAAPGNDPTPQTNAERVGECVRVLSDLDMRPPAVVAHPWEGVTTSQVLAELGGRSPRQINRRAARALLDAGYLAGAVLRGLVPHVRRADLLLFGQTQGTGGWFDENIDHLTPIDPTWLRDIQSNLLLADQQSLNRPGSSS